MQPKEGYMKKFLAILGSIIGLLTVAAAVLYVLEKKGLINLEKQKNFFVKKGMFVCDEDDEGDEVEPIDLTKMDEPAPAPKPAQRSAPKKAKEPELKSGFSANDFKL